MAADSEEAAARAALESLDTQLESLDTQQQPQQQQQQQQPWRSSQPLDSLDADQLESAHVEQSDRQYQHTLSVRRRRRQRRQLEPLPEAVDGDVSPVAVATVSAAPPASPGNGARAEALPSDSDELVLQQMQQLPGMLAHMGGRRSEREVLRHQFTSISAHLPLRQRLWRSAGKLYSSSAEAVSSAADTLTLGLYRSSFVAIEGKFGSGCASYFSFIRWLFVFNFCLSAVVLASFVLPHLLVQPRLSFEQTLPDAEQLAEQLAEHSRLVNRSWTLALAVAEAAHCSELVASRLANLSQGAGVGDSLASIVTGGTWMLQLPVFLGAYFNKSVMRVDAESGQLQQRLHFDTSVAALLSLVALLCCGVGAALATANSLYRNILRLSLRAGSGEKLAAEIFSTWDFGLRASLAVRQKQRNVTKQLNSVLLQLQLRERASSRRTLAVRCCAHAATLLLFAAAAYLIYFAIESQAMLAASRLPSALRLLVDLMPQLTISCVNLVVPLLLGKLIRFEYYGASTEVVVQLARVVLLKLLSLVTLVFTIGSVVLCSDARRDACGNCAGIDSLCWETYVGQQLYRTLAVDLLQCLLLAPLLDLLRWLASSRLSRRVACCRRVPRSELLISNDVLGLVYTQSLCFAGAFFCPFVVPIAAAAFGCLFHVKRLTLPALTVSSKSFRSSRLERFFLDVLLVFLFLLLVPLTVCVLHVAPSRGCGPYRVHQSPQFRMGDSITNWVFNSGSGMLRFLYTYTVLNSTAQILLLLLLAIISYFFYSVIKARDALIQFLERKLQNESKIKLELANRELQLLRATN